MEHLLWAGTGPSAGDKTGSPSSWSLWSSWGRWTPTIIWCLKEGRTFKWRKSDSDTRIHLPTSKGCISKQEAAANSWGRRIWFWENDVNIISKWPIIPGVDTLGISPATPSWDTHRAWGYDESISLWLPGAPAPFRVPALFQEWEGNDAHMLPPFSSVSFLWSLGYKGNLEVCWPTHFGFPGTLPVLALKVPHPGKFFLHGQSRMVGQPT